MNSEVMMPPATSSKIMLGMLFATAYEDASSVTPSAYAIDQVRTNPVTRERAVEADMTAVERAIVGLAMPTLPSVEMSSVLVGAIVAERGARALSAASDDAHVSPLRCRAVAPPFSQFGYTSAWAV